MKTCYSNLLIHRFMLIIVRSPCITKMLKTVFGKKLVSKIPLNEIESLTF